MKIISKFNGSVSCASNRIATIGNWKCAHEKHKFEKKLVAKWVKEVCTFRTTYPEEIPETLSKYRTNR